MGEIVLLNSVQFLSACSSLLLVPLQPFLAMDRLGGSVRLFGIGSFDFGVAYLLGILVSGAVLRGQEARSLGCRAYAMTITCTMLRVFSSLLLIHPETWSFVTSRILHGASLTTNVIFFQSVSVFASDASSRANLAWQLNASLMSGTVTGLALGSAFGTLGDASISALLGCFVFVSGIAFVLSLCLDFSVTRGTSPVFNDSGTPNHSLRSTTLLRTRVAMSAFGIGMSALSLETMMPLIATVICHTTQRDMWKVTGSMMLAILLGVAGTHNGLTRACLLHSTALGVGTLGLLLSLWTFGFTLFVMVNTLVIFAGIASMHVQSSELSVASVPQDVWLFQFMMQIGRFIPNGIVALFGDFNLELLWRVQLFACVLACGDGLSRAWKHEAPRIPAMV